MKLLGKLYSLLLVFALALASYMPSGEAAQYFAARYTFNNQGELAAPLTLELKTLGKKNVAAKLQPVNATTKTLMLACSMGEDVFMTTLTNGYDYALYKLKFRPDEEEDLLILSYGPHGTGKTLLKGITIIGEASGSVLKTLPVAGFSEVSVFNSPLQVRNKEAVLFRDRGTQLVRLSYDADLGSYVVHGTN